MSYEKERAIAEAATPGPRFVVWDADDHHDGKPYPNWYVKFGVGWDSPDSTKMNEADAEFIAMLTPQFVLGLLDKLELYAAALVYERGMHRWHMTAIPPGPNFIPDWKMNEEWPPLDGTLLDATLNPTEANGCADCRREGRCDVHLRLDIEATEATDDHE